MTKTLEQVLASLPPFRRERVLAEAELLALETGLPNDLAALVAAGELTVQLARKRKRHRGYYENNRDRELERSRRYRKNNLGKILEYDRRYRENHREKDAERKRRARAEKQIAEYSAEEIELIKEQARQEAREQLLAELKKGNSI